MGLHDTYDQCGICTQPRLLLLLTVINIIEALFTVLQFLLSFLFFPTWTLVKSHDEKRNTSIFVCYDLLMLFLKIKRSYYRNEINYNKHWWWDDEQMWWYDAAQGYYRELLDDGFINVCCKCDTEKTRRVC